MIIELQTGKQEQIDSAKITARGGRMGEQIVTEMQARYAELVRMGYVFSAANAASTSSAGLAATYTGGVCVSNPAGSNKNLHILKVSVGLVVISAAVTVAGLAAGWAQGGVTAHTTALVPQNNLLGSQIQPVAKADQAATLVGTPFFVLPAIASTGIAAGVYGVTIDVEGSIIVPPGGYVCTTTQIASPALGSLDSITWAEVPV